MPNGVGFLFCLFQAIWSMTDPEIFALQFYLV